MANKIVEKIKTKWNIKTDRDFILIMLVFSLAGMGVGVSRRAIFALLGLSHASIGIQIAISLLLIVPLYQLSTLFFGALLGQFGFFWGRQKKIGRFLLKSFSHAWLLVLRLFMDTTA